MAGPRAGALRRAPGAALLALCLCAALSTCHAMVILQVRHWHAQRPVFCGATRAVERQRALAPQPTSKRPHRLQQRHGQGCWAAPNSRHHPDPHRPRRRWRCRRCRLALPEFASQTGNFTLEFPALPADFGPDIPPAGVSGLLFVADPEDACEPLQPPRLDEATVARTAPWVALIRRSQDIEGCSFDVKARLPPGWAARRRLRRLPASQVRRRLPPPNRRPLLLAACCRWPTQKMRARWLPSSMTTSSSRSFSWPRRVAAACSRAALAAAGGRCQRVQALLPRAVRSQPHLACPRPAGPQPPRPIHPRHLCQPEERHDDGARGGWAGAGPAELGAPLADPPAVSDRAANRARCCRFSCRRSGSWLRARRS